MTNRMLVPIIVGITGKRDLEGHDPQVLAGLKEALDIIDERYPGTPKIMLSALAVGADTLAAEEALRRKEWRIIAPLPLSLDLYFEDFDETAAARMRTIVDNPDVTTLPLQPLLDPKTQAPFTTEALRRRPGSANPERSLHYEQVGLFIAQRSALLLAVLPAGEKPGRIGGTARIVHYRVHGELDDVARDVIAQSRELRPQTSLDHPYIGPVWRIGLAPGASGSPRHRSNSPEVMMPPEWAQHWPHTQGWMLHASLAISARIHAFNRRVLAISEKNWRRKVAPRATLDGGDATSAIRSLRAAMSVIQTHAKNSVRRSLFALALLFCAAVTAFETRFVFANVDWQLGIWGAYLAAAFIALAVYWRANRMMWQPIAEDYRGVAEALRVQMAWWDSGIRDVKHSAEQFFLQGTSGSLGLVRAAVRHFVDAALLLRPAGAPVPNAAATWIDGQIAYFEARIGARQFWISVVSAGSWLLFLGALGSATLVGTTYLTQNANAYVYGVLSNWVWVHVSNGWTFLATLFGMTVVFAISVLLRSSPLVRRHMHRMPVLRFLGNLTFWLGGILFGFSLYDFAAWLLSHGANFGFAQMLIQGISMPVEEASKQGGGVLYLGRELATIATVLPAAFAGTLRFIAEKLSLEAELHGYEDAVELFRRAKAELAEIDRGHLDPEAAARRREMLVVSLGKEALEESEGWLRAHRERPLEPVVGS
jgi:hypothetical protein